MISCNSFALFLGKKKMLVQGLFLSFFYIEKLLESGMSELRALINA